jgi:hypothetical protein
MDEEKLLEQLLDPSFDMEKLSFDNEAALIAYCYNQRELFQMMVGKIAFYQKKKRGENSLGKLVSAVEGIRGKKTTIKSITQYRLVYERMQPYLDKIPADYSYSAWRALALNTDNPGKWLEKALAAGWSSSELIRNVNIAKGMKLPDRKLICKSCYFKNKDSNICLVCHNTL